MKWDVINIEGKKVKSIDLPDEVYGLEMNEAVLHSVVKAYRANRRQGTHAVKTRAFVSGGGKKPFKQKGTGNARQGTSRSPLMPGGAVLHGPQPRDYTQHINHKVKQLALKVALSDKIRHKTLVIVDDFAVKSYSTKQVLQVLKNLGHQDSKVLLSDSRSDDFLYRSSRNIHRVGTVPSAQVNAEDVLGHELLIISESAVQTLGQRLQGKA